LLPGCAGSQTTTSRAGDAPGFVALYESGQYQAAYDKASVAAQSPNTRNRDEAALVAGLSAQALGKNADAVRWLTPLRLNADGNIAGRSSAALGLMSRERGDHESAAQYLALAARKLTGDERARAWMYAGDSYSALARGADARDAYDKAAQSVGEDAALRAMIGDRQSGKAPATPQPLGTTASPTSAKASTLTVQIGAYASLKTAKEQVQTLSRKGKAARIVQIGKGGKTLYAVRVGTFTSRAAAESVRKSIGGGAMITPATGET
jgi:tetratricopeptide (TPR) repeat protein